MQPHTLMRPRSREPVTANPGSGPHAYAKLKHSFNFNPRSTNGGKSHPALRIQHPVRSGSGPAGGGGEEFGGAAEDGLSGHFEVVGGPDFAELARPVAHGVDFAFEHDIVDRPAVVGNRDAVGAEKRLFAAAHFNIRQMDDPFVASGDPFELIPLKDVIRLHEDAGAGGQLDHSLVSEQKGGAVAGRDEVGAAGFRIDSQGEAVEQGGGETPQGAPAERRVPGIVDHPDAEAYDTVGVEPAARRAVDRCRVGGEVIGEIPGRADQVVAVRRGSGAEILRFGFCRGPKPGLFQNCSRHHYHLL